MKVIKHLNHETPSHKLKMFFKQMPLITRLILPLIICTSILLTIMRASRKFTIYSFLDARLMSEIFLFLIVALTDFQKQQRKGSIFFILSYFLKISLLAGFNEIVNLILYLTGIEQGFFSTTSYPFLFCLMISYRDMVLRANEQRYFLIASFQIKYLFYPIFLFIILQLIGLRIDILSALIISLLGTAIKLDEFLIWVSKKIDNKILTNKAIFLGMLATGRSEATRSQIDRIKTNYSIDLEEN